MNIVFIKKNTDGVQSTRDKTSIVRSEVERKPRSIVTFMAPLYGPETILQDMEYSIHACPSRHAKEVESIFPGLCADGVLVIPTCQKTTMDLARVGEQVEQEKDACLERFMRWSKLVCESLERKGCWSDYVDPCSGLPMIHREQAHRVYGEVDALSTLLGYDTINSGCCKIVLHPRWGSCVYPATLFARCDVQTLQESIREATDAM